VGTAIGIWLLVMECFDALVTPKPDWLWFGAAALLIWLCRPRKEAPLDISRSGTSP
jgi:hypothetical protein